MDYNSTPPQDKPLPDLNGPMERLSRFAVAGESGFQVYPGGIFCLTGPNTFYGDIRALISLAQSEVRMREALEAIADGEGYADVIAQQTLDEVQKLARSALSHRGTES